LRTEKSGFNAERQAESTEQSVKEASVKCRRRRSPQRSERRVQSVEISAASTEREVLSAEISVSSTGH